MGNQDSKEILSGKIRKYLNNYGITDYAENFDNQTAEKFYTLYNELMEWNKKINITAITDEDEFIRKHIVDSAFLLKVLNKKSKSVIDAGSGAGFPGIILNILRPSLNVISVESVLKKCNFQKNISRKLSLRNFECLNLNIFSYKNFNGIDAVATRAAFNAEELPRFIEKLDLAKETDLYLFLSKMDEVKKIENSEYKSKYVRLDRILFYKTDYDNGKDSDFRLIAKLKAAPR